MSGQLWPFSGMEKRKVRYIAFYTCIVPFVFYIPDDGHMVGQNMLEFIVYIN